MGEDDMRKRAKVRHFLKSSLASANLNSLANSACFEEDIRKETRNERKVHYCRFSQGSFLSGQQSDGSDKALHYL